MTYDKIGHFQVIRKQYNFVTMWELNVTYYKSVKQDL